MNGLLQEFAYDETSGRMKPEIILIGPISSGKTSVAELLSMRTGLPRRSMAEQRWKYYDEIGYDRDLARQKRTREGFWGLYRYWKPFEAYAVGKLLSSFCDCIFDMGGAHTVYEDDHLFRQVRDLLAPYPHVVLLIPSPDHDESIQILHERNYYDSDGQREVNEHLVRHLPIMLWPSISYTPKTRTWTRSVMKFTSGL